VHAKLGSAEQLRTNDGSTPKSAAAQSTTQPATITTTQTASAVTADAATPKPASTSAFTTNATAIPAATVPTRQQFLLCIHAGQRHQSPNNKRRVDSL